MLPLKNLKATFGNCFLCRLVKIYLTIVCIGCSNIAIAQTNDSIDIAKSMDYDFIASWDSLPGMYENLWLWQGQYFNLLFEYPDKADVAFDFREDRIDQYIPEVWKKIMRDHKSDFTFQTTDSTLDIFYKDSLLARYSTDIRCKDFTLYRYRNYSIRGIYPDGAVLLNDSLTNEYKKEVNRILISAYENHDYQVVYLPTIEIIHNVPPYILYEYDVQTGLTIHKICQCEYPMYHNKYTEDLESFAKQMCQKYGFTRLLFTSVIMNAKN